MRTFNDREKQIIQNIQDAGKSGSYIAMGDFLQKLYFGAQSGRALIIQSQLQYAVFFLAPAVFDDAKKNSEEVRQFFELISLLNFLYRNGYITIYREKTELLYFFQETFSNEKASNNTIVLNAKGDYTFSPDTIHDRNKNVIYKGLMFHADVFSLIMAATTGVMVLSDHFEELLNAKTEETYAVTVLPPTAPTAPTAATPAPALPVKNKTPHVFKLSLLLSALGLLLLAAACYLLYEKSKGYDEHFKKMAGNDTTLQHTVSNGFTDLKQTIRETSAPAAHSADSLKYLHGVDISKWNGDAIVQIDATDSISFIICRATIGITGIDPEFDKNWQIIRNKKCILGAYHFYLADDDPLKQAEHFMGVINLKGKTDMPLIVDVEQESLISGKPVNKAKLHKDLILFLKQVEKTTGRKPMIYTGLDFADTYLLNKDFAGYALWLADYTQAARPQVPVTWKETGYKIWQKRDNYFIDTHVYDFDLFHGKASELCR